ncbi:flexible cuticle protein 12-like [Uranotaenia lowii]|uniref:flexible cuticle protein 12-like n=1 Tax=Uranotaenia lowii TaxID=190385 RepID=UPI00247A71D0|nr:flexible cuticle protein 12-like [Uranotaenia lowii]
MKFALVFVTLLALACSLPVPDDKEAQVLRFDNDHHGIDGYSWNLETSNGIQQQEQAELRSFPDDNSAIVVRGSYSYLGADGVTYTVNYIADENGFQPQGDHLPKAS